MEPPPLEPATIDTVILDTLEAAAEVELPHSPPTAVGVPTEAASPPLPQVEAAAVAITDAAVLPPPSPITTTLNRNHGNPKSKIRTWQEMYDCLLKYATENGGSVAVPRLYKPDKNLGEWVVKQRMYQRKLTAEQRKKLEDVGFSFESRLEGYERKWQEMFAELLEFQKENNGSCVVPDRRRKDQTHGKLARWIHYQRKHYNRGNLAQERIDKLESVGFVWHRQGPKAHNKTKKCGKPRKEPDTSKIDARWNAFYVKLEEYHKEHGNVKILQDHPDQPFYFWFKTQRTLMHQGLLRADRKERMDQLGMVWDTKETLTKNWEVQFQRLVQYKQETGTINCAHRYEPHGLGNWIAYQKRTFREGTIEPDRAKRLLDVEMAYIAEKDPSWNSRFAKLKMASTWQELTKDPELERWACLQLVLQDCDKLSRDRRIMLDSIRIKKFAAMEGGPLFVPRQRIPVHLLPPEATTVVIQTPKTTTPSKKRKADAQADTTSKDPATPNATPNKESTTNATNDGAADSTPTAVAAAETNEKAADDAAPEPMAVDQAAVDETATEGPIAATTTTTDPTATAIAAAAAAAGAAEGQAPAEGEAAAPQVPTVQLKRKRGRPRLYPVKPPSGRAKKRTWDESFQALASFHEKTGSAKLPSAYPDDPALLKWTKKQRTFKHSLTEEQTQKLQSIGFCFDGHIEIREKKWEERFNELLEFMSRKGNSLVTRKDNKDLNIWVIDQRKKYRTGTIRQDRMERLEKIGFTWNAEHPNQTAKRKKNRSMSAKSIEAWQEKYNQLTAFSKLHGHCDVKSVQDHQLHLWIRKQRTLHQKKLLPAERVEKLTKLNFVWRHKAHNDELAWNSKFDMLVAFKEKEGHCEAGGKDDRWGVGIWAGTQRSTFKTGEMFPERARRLLTLGFKAPPERENSWHGRRKKLKAMTRDDYDEIWKDPPFERWVELQQVLIKNDALADDRKKLFQEIDLIWENQDGGGQEGTNQNSGAAGEADANANAGGDEASGSNNDSSDAQQKDNSITVVDVCAVVRAAAANDNEQPRQNSTGEAIMI